MIYELEKANKQQCLEMIDYFLKINCIEAVIAYTKRLYGIVGDK